MPIYSDPTSSRPSITGIVLIVLGAGCFLMGGLILAGVAPGGHPLLQGPEAAIAFIVSGVALVGSAGFPIALRRLAARDAAGMSSDRSAPGGS